MISLFTKNNIQLEASLIRLAPWMAKCYQWTYNLLSYGSQSIWKGFFHSYIVISYGSYFWRQSDTFFGIWPRKLLYVLRLLKRFWWIAHLNSKQEAALWSSRSWIVPTHPLLMNFHLSNFDIENLHTAPDGRLHSGPIEKQSSKLSLTHCTVFLL